VDPVEVPTMMEHGQGERKPRVAWPGCAGRRAVPDGGPRSPV